MARSRKLARAMRLRRRTQALMAASGGRIVLVGEVTGTKVEMDMAAIYRRGLEIRSAVSTSRRQLEMALRLVSAGAVRPMVERTLPLRDAASAHRLVEDNAVVGRIVLIP